MKQAPATPQSLEICYLMSAEWAAFKALNWTQSVLRYVLKTPLVSPPPCHTRSLSMSMQDSLHPWMTNPSDPEGAFRYPALMMESPWDKVSLFCQPSQLRCSFVSMLAACVTTSDLTPLPSLLSRHQSVTVDNPRYSDRPCHIMILPAVVVRVGMLRRRVLDCGSRRGWKGTGSGSDPTPASTLAGTLFPISGADLRPQISQ
jgi:hypothetical protein